MSVSNEKQLSYKMNIEKAINAIQENDFITALGYIKSAVIEDQASPEIHNLLGIIAEFNRDLNLACRHYRASYALDPTFKPASKNLDRVTSFFYNPVNTCPIYGDIPEEEVIPYTIEYDEMNVGHLKKNKNISE